MMPSVPEAMAGVTRMGRGRSWYCWFVPYCVDCDVLYYDDKRPGLTQIQEGTGSATRGVLGADK